MQFVCETCRANLKIADEKLRGKRLIVRCKRCGVQIRIADPALGASRRPSLAGAEPGTVPPPPPLHAFAGEPAEWFAVIRGDQCGPLTASEIKSKRSAGEIHPGTYVWKAGMEAWVRAQTVRDLAALFPAPSPPPAEEAENPGVQLTTPAEGSVSPFADAPVSAVSPLAAAPVSETASPPVTGGAASSTPVQGVALDLARWGAEELSKPRAETPVPAAATETQSAPSISKPEFRVAQSRRRSPVRAALVVVGIAAVASLAAFAIFYQRKDAARSAQEVAQSGSPPPVPAATEPPKAAEQNAAQPGATDSARGTVPSPDVLKKKVDESMPALQGCVDQALQREPALRVGKILILTTVAPSGEVTSTRIDKKNIDQSQLGACLKSAARNIHFPSFTGEAFPLDIPIVVAGGE